MGPSSRRLLLPAFVALATLSVFLLSELLTVAFSDYEEEALPAITALLGGDLHGFLTRLPSYGGSLLLRAPAALGADALGFGELGVARALALPCLLAAFAYGVAACAQLAPRTRPSVPLAAWLALLVVVANPLILPALSIGHPEELLGGVACAAAVLLALRDRDVLAGVALGIAGANKPWAVLALIPVLVALSGHRVRTTVIAGGVCGLVLAPIVLSGGHAVAAASSVATGTGQIFQPWQLWWFLGDHGATVMGLYAEKPGFRAAPAFPGGLAHPLAILVPLLLSAFLARRLRREDALLLLALCFALRCGLDPWNTAYYELPLVLALVGHEVFVARRAPLVALAVTVLAYVGMTKGAALMSPDGQAAFFLAWWLALTAGLARVLAQRPRERAPARAAVLGGAAEPVA